MIENRSSPITLWPLSDNSAQTEDPIVPTPITIIVSGMKDDGTGLKC